MLATFTSRIRGTNRIRKVTIATGIISTVAGTGTACSSSTSACGDSGAATSAQLNQADDVALDSAGNLYIADTSDNRIRMVAATTGLISTVAGTGVACGSSCGDGSTATSARLAGPGGIAFDLSGNLYIADTNAYRIRKVNKATGIISSVAGNAARCPNRSGACGDGGAATSANFYDPIRIALDNAGNLYVSDKGENRFREVNAATGIISRSLARRCERITKPAALDDCGFTYNAAAALA